MSDGASMTIANQQQFINELLSLPDIMQKRLMKGAVATGCSVIRKDAIARAPQYTGEVSDGHPPPGTLKKAIYQVRLVDECTSTIEAWKVDVRKGKKARAVKRGKGVANLDAYYAGWVEYGHYTRAPKSAGGTRKARRNAISMGTQMVSGAHFVLPQPFMRPAFETKKQAALNAMQAYLDNNLPTATLALQFIKAQGF